MHAAVRSPLISGIALAGAGAIAMSPLVVPPEEIEVAVSRISSVPVQLTANPLAIYEQAIGTALESTGQLVGRLAEIVGPTLSPAFVAFLAEVGIENATALVEFLNPESLINYATGLPETFQTYLTALQTFGQTVFERIPTEVPAGLEEAFGLLAEGDFEGAVNTLLSIPLDLVGLDVLGPLLATAEFLDSLLPLPIVQDVVNGAIGGLNGAGLFLGLSAPLINLAGAFGTGVQGVIDAAEAGDPLGAVGAMIAVPGVILDGVLNGGYGPGLPLIGTPFPGLLTPTGLLGPIGAGTVSVILTVAESILTNLGWDPPASMAASEMSATEVPAEGAATVTLAVADSGAKAGDGALGADAALSGGPGGEEDAPATGSDPEAQSGSEGEEIGGEEDGEENNAGEENTGGDDASDDDASDEDASDEDASDEDGKGSDDDASDDDDSTDTSMKDGNKAEPGDVGDGPAGSDDNDDTTATDQNDDGAGDGSGDSDSDNSDSDGGEG